ncbi:unnamed protein product [Didymodactylos carnosus]|uniref:Glycosyltransferase family 92 protein n=1 Tax=Didymodactylos carnosus TaxID=1234261 RepID=A0A815PEZ8_9BILA|nr:unnamed protein product [Didymodactylos carnosus]CAF4322767.1 unnamed protein product [Didymodactylos carnosus]
MDYTRSAIIYLLSLKMNKLYLCENNFKFRIMCTAVLFVIIFLLYTHFHHSKSFTIASISRLSLKDTPLIKPTSHVYFPGNQSEHIFDFVVVNNTLDPSVDAYLFLSGSLLFWPYIQFYCIFIHTGINTTGSVDMKWTQIQITCPIPKAELNQRQISVLFMNQVTNKSIFNTQINIPIYSRAYHNISIYTMIKNKSEELVEWIEYHLLLGIEHFYLYDNLSEDMIDNVLIPYMNSNIVTLIRWPFAPYPGKHWNSIQTSSMNHCLKSFGPFNRWIGYFDVDEYFQPNDEIIEKIFNKSRTLAELLDENFEEQMYPGAVQFINWSISCFLSRIDVLKSRYHLNIEKCKFITKQSPPKMFIRPRNVPAMHNIHALESGLKFKTDTTWKEFGRFRHYNGGNHGDILPVENTNNNSNFVVDKTIMKYVILLREKIIRYR